MSSRRTVRCFGLILMLTISGMTAALFLYPIERFGKRGAAVYWLVLLAAILFLMIVALADLVMTYRERRRLIEELRRSRGGEP